MPNEISKNQDILFSDIRHIIEEARSVVSQTINVGLTRSYWSIGKRIRQDVLHGERAEYGQQIISTLSRQLTEEYGIQRPDGTLSPLAGKERNRTR